MLVLERADNVKYRQVIISALVGVVYELVNRYSNKLPIET
jgi:hypothetical protein